MADNIINGYDNDMSNATTNEDRQNIALSLQAVGSIVAASTAIATLNVDYETRDQVGDSIDSLYGHLGASTELRFHKGFAKGLAAHDLTVDYF